MYKTLNKTKIKSAAFQYLSEIQSTHSKVRGIAYQNLEIQKYMLSPIFTNEEVHMLHALISRSTEVKENFKQKYVHSNLLCSLCQSENEDQKHILQCSVILNNYRTKDVSRGKVEYGNIFTNDVSKQKEITSVYIELFEIRRRLQKNLNSQLAPSPADAELMISENLLEGIVHLSSGK